MPLTVPGSPEPHTAIDWQPWIDLLACGLVVWDGEDRLVACNRDFRELYGPVASHIVPGMGFEALLRLVISAGLVPQALGNEDAWIQQRLDEHRNQRSGTHLRQMRNGRWRRIIETPLRGGGVLAFSIDVTEMIEQGQARDQAFEEARLARQRLDDAVQALPDGFALYDADDRLVVCNQRYREIYRESAAAMVLGATFEDILRYGLQRGQYPQAAGREEAWLAERLHRHRHPGPPEIQQIPGNRWLRIDERTTRDGGIAGVRTEVTELVRREQRLEELNAQLQAAQSRLEALSETDPLTGLANRRLFDRRLSEEWSRLARHGMSLSLLMVDIDHFKPYNDRHGHLEGDACLRRVAAALASCGGRPTDVVARLGGEEFALLLPHTDEDAATVLAMRCIAAIDAMAIPHGASPVGPEVTISVGGVSFAERPTGDPQLLLRAADEALYRAKVGGRHRAEFATTRPTSP